MGERLPASRNSYVCNFSGCKATFSKTWKLNAHLCKHTGLRPFSCENCPKSFCTQCQLTRHELSHSGEKSHKCLAEACPEVFATQSTMKKHMASVHQHQRKRYECDHLGCEKYFIKKYKLTAHKAEHGQTQPEFFCTFKGCLKAFSSVCKLRRHQKVHKGYACEEVDCDFQGKTWTELQNHRKEHAIKLQCSDCKKLFANAWFLDQHQLNVHSGEKRVFPCPNEGCEKTFTSRFNLQSHILGDHECKKPFGCAYSGCGKSFTMKESLWRHGVVHDPLKRKIEKLSPKKNQPWRKEVGILATRLHNTNLMDTDP